MKFKERNSDFLYEAKMGGGYVFVKMCAPQSQVERLTVEEFIERFDESNV